MKKTSILLMSILIFMGLKAEAFAQNRIMKSRITKVSTGVHLLKKADQNYRLGKIKKARKYYKKSLDLGLDKAEKTAALNNICALYNVEEHYNLARKYCTKALKISPYYWRSYNNRGAAYFGLGLFTKAAQDFEKASHLNAADETLKQNKKLAQSNLSR
jgi:tetratricopeptide (TPR) repeat protein